MEWNGLWYTRHRDVYEPCDDTFILARAIEDAVRPGQRVIEVGCGAGLVALCAARKGAHVLALDRNPAAVRLARRHARQNDLPLSVAVGDLLSAAAGPVDIVAFNPPYLPTADDDHVHGPLDWAFDGGPDGNTVVLRFCDQLAAMPERPEQVFVVHSSLSDPEPLITRMEGLGYAHDVAASDKEFFETVWVRRFVR